MEWFRLTIIYLSECIQNTQKYGQFFFFPQMADFIVYGLEREEEEKPGRRKGGEATSVKNDLKVLQSCEYYQ